MNIHSTKLESPPTREEAETALLLLRTWIAGASPVEMQDP